MDNNIIEIGRACNYYRPYYLHGKSLRKILFFSNGKILFSTDGWLEDCHKDVEKIKIFSPIKKER